MQKFATRPGLDLWNVQPVASQYIDYTVVVVVVVLVVVVVVVFYRCTVHSVVYLITHTDTHTHTHIYIYIYNLRSLKFTLQHLKRSYMFRSHDHPQGAYIIPC